MIGMKRLGVLSCVLLIGTAIGSAQQPGASIWGGAFTADQAKRGDDAYQASCSSCHGSDLHATNGEAVDLKGPSLLAGWKGKTLQDRFERIRDTMPAGSENSLGDKTYLDILAFILQSNGFPPGAQELGPDTAKGILVADKP